MMMLFLLFFFVMPWEFFSSEKKKVNAFFSLFLSLSQKGNAESNDPLA